MLDEPDTDENTQIVSYSELDTFRMCPLKHNLGYQQRWTHGVKVGGALDKGTQWHAVLETHYRTLAKSRYNGHARTPKQTQDALRVCWRAVEPLLFGPGGEQTEVQELVTWMYLGYVEKWGINEDWKILGIEHAMQMALPDENGVPSRYVLKAKIDLLIHRLDLNTRWVVDHKSGAELPTAFDLDMDDQFGLYVYLMKRAGKPVQGALHNAARTTRNKGDFTGEQHGNAKPQPLEKRFKHSLLTRNDKELENIALDAFRAAQAAYPPPGMVRSLYSSPDPRNCGWKCDFRTAHLLMRGGRPANEALLSLGFRVDRTRH